MIVELRQHFPLKVLLKVSRVPKATFFYTVKKAKKDGKNEEVIKQIIEIFHQNKGRYGYRRIQLELANRGYPVNHKKIKRIMHLLGICGKTPRAKYKSYKGNRHGTCDNLLLQKVVSESNDSTTFDRDFVTTSCNQKWTTDVSEFHIAAGKLYLSPILDMHNREIVSYNQSKNPNYYQTSDMLRKALDKYDNLEGLILHSDQGWQYQMSHYHQELKRRGIRQSMSRKGNCLDNSPMESFFGVMKNEMFYGHEHEYQTLEQLEQAIHDYIKYYNSGRIMVKTKGLSPYMYRQQSSIQIVC